MMKRGRLFCILILLAFLFVVPTISAIDTEITIKTLPYHRVQVSILNPGGMYSLIESFHEDSGSSGEVSVIFSSFAIDSFSVRVWVKKDSQQIVYKKFEEAYPTGTPLVLEVYPEWYVKEETNETTLEENSTINETGSETPTISEDSEEEESKFTGFAFFEEGKFFSKKIVIITEGVMFLIICFLILIFFKKNKRKLLKDFKEARKTDEDKGEKRESSRNEAIIEDAEEKIKEAQEEIRSIKNQDKIIEANKKLIEDKKKLIEDQEELIKLKEGKD